jgi:hypothetical protein
MIEKEKLKQEKGKIRDIFDEFAPKFTKPNKVSNEIYEINTRSD